MRSFVKFAVVVALIAGLILEVGSPLWTRPGVTGAAQDAASAAAQDFFTSNNLDSAKDAAISAAKFRGATLTGFSGQPDGSIRVTVYRHASPHGLDRFSQFKHWYNVTASSTATAAPH